MSYNRNLSPGSRRLVNPARASDSNVDAYLNQRHNSYVSPRTSGERVIPISTQTFINVPSSSSGSGRSNFDAYSGRPRRSSLLDQSRSSRRPQVIQEDFKRTSSPPKSTREYYVVPATSKEPSKKVYSIEESGARLVTGEEQHRHLRRHKRRESEDRTSDDRARRAYPITPKVKTVDDEDAFSYTDAAGMYRETEPSWRQRQPEPRQRRASVDREGSNRPLSVLVPYSDTRKRDGPPPSLRGFDKINDGIGRTKSVREGPREVLYSPARATHDRRNSIDRSRPAYDYDSLDEYEYDQRPTRHERIPQRQDRSVSRRGFGVRPESEERGPGRNSDENLSSKRREGYDRAYPSDVERRDTHRRRESKQEQYSDDYDTDDRQHRKRRERDDERSGISSTAKVAAGGLAASAALYGLTRDKDSNDEKSRRDKDRHHSAPYPEADDRGLGFAYEAPSEAPKQIKDASAKEDEHAREDPAPAAMPEMPDPDEEYRRRMQQAQRDLGLKSAPTHEPDPERERRRREREARHQGQHERSSHDAVAGAYPQDRSPLHSTFDKDGQESSVASSRPNELRRRPSIIDEPMPAEPTAQIIDNSMSEKRENRVRIVDPPTEEEDKRPKGILKKPTVKFPEDHNTIREGVAPLKDATKKGIPPGARWTKIDRRLVNPEALEEAKERYEERLDCVIVLRVLTKEEIQKLADRTKELRDKRFEADRAARRRDRDRERDRYDRDEYSDDGLEDWEREEKKPVRMLEAGPSQDNNDRHKERDGSYVSSRTARD